MRIPAFSSSLWLSLALLLGTGSLMGLTNTLVKQAGEQGWPALGFLLSSLFGAGLLLLGGLSLGGQRPGFSYRECRYYLISALLSLTLTNAILFSAIAHVGAGYASICMAFPPLLTYLLALLLGMEKLHPLRLLGLLIGLGGTLLLALDKAFSGDSPLLWVVALLLSPWILALGNIYRSRAWPRGANPLALAPGMLLAACLQLLPIILLSGSDWLPASASPQAWWLLLGQTLVFALTYALYFTLQKVAGPVYLSQIGAIAAVVGTALAVLVLGEDSRPSMYLAILAIACGVLLVSRQGQSPRSARHAD